MLRKQGHDEDIADSAGRDRKQRALFLSSLFFLLPTYSHINILKFRDFQSKWVHINSLGGGSIQHIQDKHRVYSWNKAGASVTPLPSRIVSIQCPV